MKQRKKQPLKSAEPTLKEGGLLSQQEVQGPVPNAVPMRTAMDVTAIVEPLSREQVVKLLNDEALSLKGRVKVLEELLREALQLVSKVAKVQGPLQRPASIVMRRLKKEFQ